MTKIISMRADGFGERIKAMVNAICVADITHKKFSFHWAPMLERLRIGHSVDPAESTFSKSFLENHFMEMEEIKRLKILPFSNVERQISNYSIGEDDTSAITLSQQQLEKQAPYFFQKYVAQINMRAAFERIEFNENLEHARFIGNTLALGASPVAIHLRAGDIIFGRYRFIDRYHGKVLNVPLAEELIRHLRDIGHQIILFGQDNDLIQFLEEKYDTFSTSGICANHKFSFEQQAIFDICVMSRCEKIFAGSSGFAQLSSWIGSSPIVYPGKVFKSEKVTEIVKAYIEDKNNWNRISSLHLAFALRNACVLSKNTIPTSEPYATFMTQASRFDPENDSYPFSIAIAAYEQGNIGKAEEIIYGLLSQDDVQDRSIAFILCTRSPTGEMMSDEFLKILRKHALHHLPMASLCLAISLNAQKKVDEARIFAKQFFDGCPHAWKKVGYDVVSSFKIEK